MIKSHNPFTDTDNPIIIKAFNAGIINGVGNNLFAPDASLSRQELCVMIIRAMTASGIVFGDDKEYTFQKSYSDEETISSWATTQVRIMNDFKIMNGTGDKLEPLAPLSVEQSIIMLERAFLRDFTIEGTTLIAYTGNSSEITVPNGVTDLNDSVFYSNNFMTTITLPSTVMTIRNTAFKECNSLTTINLNEGLVTIGEAAFEDCPYLVFVCDENSSAHQYAVENNLAFELN